MGGDAEAQRLHVLDLASLDGEQHVAAPDARALGRAALVDVAHQHADGTRQAQRRGALRGYAVALRAEPGAHELLARASAGDDGAHHRRRDGEADAERSAAAVAVVDRGVDADEAAIDAHQRAAGISGIDGGVGLDEEAVVGDADLRARQRRDDAERHGLPDAEGITDREHDVADLEFVGVGEGERRQALGAGVDLQHGEVRALVGPQDLRRELAPVGEDHLDLVGARDDVVVRDHDARGVDDHAGAERVLDPPRRLVGEELAEARVGHHPGRDVASRVDVHHRRRRASHHGREGKLDVLARLGNDALHRLLRMGLSGGGREGPPWEEKPRRHGRDECESLHRDGVWCARRGKSTAKARRWRGHASRPRKAKGRPSRACPCSGGRARRRQAAGAASACAAAAAATRSRSALPLASTSRSTSSITAIAAMSPWRFPAFSTRV